MITVVIATRNDNKYKSNPVPPHIEDRSHNDEELCFEVPWRVEFDISTEIYS